jgi:hypothetical protein
VDLDLVSVRIRLGLVELSLMCAFALKLKLKLREVERSTSQVKSFERKTLSIAMSKVLLPYLVLFCFALAGLDWTDR